MIILAIETSCDETAVSIVEAEGGLEQPCFNVLAHLVHSQVDLHALYGGVVPMLAKREHAKQLTPLLQHALSQAGLLTKIKNRAEDGVGDQIREILTREEGLAENLLNFLGCHERPAIDAIAVTYGPGLEPALWVGINFAKALALAWDKPLLPINHLEGHVLSVLINPKQKTDLKIDFPALALIVSGGHTELVLMKNYLQYELLGQTRDDAAGEAFDKVARILGLPYPGGPEISKLAEKALGHQVSKYNLPRPMMHSGNFDFSFSGLKTAVLYLVKKLGGLEGLDESTKIAIAYEFQEAVIEVLVHKTLRAIKQYQPQTIIAAGGVMANKQLKLVLELAIGGQNASIKTLFPTSALATDNATMIAVAAYFRSLSGHTSPDKHDSRLIANGNLGLS